MVGLVQNLFPLRIVKYLQEAHSLVWVIPLF